MYHAIKSKPLFTGDKWCCDTTATATFIPSANSTRTTAAAASTTATAAEAASHAERTKSATVGQSVGGTGRRVRRLLVTIRRSATLHQLVFFIATRRRCRRRRQQARSPPVGHRGRYASGPRPLSRQPCGVLVAEPAHVTRLSVVLVLGRSVWQRWRRRWCRVRMWSVGLRRRRGRHGLRMRQG